MEDGIAEKIHERSQYTATFNIKSWKGLSEAEQGRHTFKNCRACQNRLAPVQALFPVKSTQFIGSTGPKVLSFLNDAIDSCMADQTR